MFGVWGTLQPPEVCLPLTLATEPDLPLGFRLSQLEALHSGNHLLKSLDLHGAICAFFESLFSTLQSMVKANLSQ